MFSRIYLSVVKYDYIRLLPLRFPEGMTARRSRQFRPRRRLPSRCRFVALEGSCRLAERVIEDRRK